MVYVGALQGADEGGGEGGRGGAGGGWAGGGTQQAPYGGHASGGHFLL